MQQEHVTSLSPTSLTDLELLRYAEEFANGKGMPKSFQREIARRFAQKIIGSY